MSNAAIPMFKPEVVPTIRMGSITMKILSYDVSNGTPHPGRGAQRRGPSPKIIDARNYEDHTQQATHAESPLFPPIPIPQEIRASLAWIIPTPSNVVIEFRDAQLLRLHVLVADCAQSQATWADLPHPPRFRTLVIDLRRWLFAGY